MKPDHLSATLLVFFLGVAASLGSQPPPGTVLWTYEAASTILWSPALAADGTIYIGTYTGLYAITKAGACVSNKWVFPAHTRGSPSIGADGTIYFGDDSTNVNLNALDPSGALLWAFPIQKLSQSLVTIRSSPAVAGDNTIYCVASGRLYAFTHDGTRKWDVQIDDGSIVSALSPVVGADGTIYVGSNLGLFYAFNPEGTVKWSVGGLGNPGESAAIGADGTVYFTSGLSPTVPLYAFAPDGTRLWSNWTNEFSGASPVVGKDGTIYVGSYPGRTLYAVRPDGVATWQALSEFTLRYPPPPTSPATDTSGMLYYCVSNSVFALTSQGQVQWVVTAPGTPAVGTFWATTSPVIGPDGTIYAALNTKLYAIAGTNALGDTPWPMYRQNARHTGKVEKPVLKPPQKRSDANFEFQLYPQQLGLTYTVESSSNLYKWTSLTSFVANTLPTDVVDLTASNAPARFYRAFSGP